MKIGLARKEVIKRKVVTRTRIGGTGANKNKRVTYQKPRRPIKFNDGFNTLVQTSREHFFSPHGDTGPYHGVEITYPNEREALLLPYTHTPHPRDVGHRTDTICERSNKSDICSDQKA